MIRSTISALRLRHGLLCALALALCMSAAHARQGEPPITLRDHAKLGANIPVETVRGIDPLARRAELARAESAKGMRSKRERVADLQSVDFDSAEHGRWDALADGLRVWRLSVRAPGATDLRLTFGHFALPRGARLYVIGADGYYQGPYSRADASADSFHAPLVPGDTATVELQVPAAIAQGDDYLRITAVGAGFRDRFGRSKGSTGPGTSGSCNINVVCPLGQPYPDQIRAVGQYEFNSDGGTYICSGTLLNDVPGDRRNFFLTAAHCISTSAEAQSITVFWNYQSTSCSSLIPPSGGYFNDDQHGATLRATREDVDATLLELSGTPEASWNLHYAGWDATGATPSGTVGIHHPMGDAKKITAGPQPSTTNNCIGGTGNNTHWLTGPYSQGTTEGGSSGSALFSKAGNANGSERRVIGTLSGGDALCSTSAPTQPNDGHDCYGKFSVAWSGSGNSSANRLRDWLDPGNTNTLSINGLDQNATSSSSDGHSRHAMPPDIGARIGGR